MSCEEDRESDRRALRECAIERLRDLADRIEAGLVEVSTLGLRSGTREFSFDGETLHREWDGSRTYTVVASGAPEDWKREVLQ